jgi:hypothetical protein
LALNPSQGLEELMRKCALLKAASLELRSNVALQQVIVFVLEVGNYMNQGSSQGQAASVSLLSLARLDAIQATSTERQGARSQQQNLIHYIARTVLRKKPALLEGCKRAIKPLQLATVVNLEQLKTDNLEYSTRLELLEQEVEWANEAGGRNQRRQLFDKLESEEGASEEGASPGSAAISMARLLDDREQQFAANLGPRAKVLDQMMVRLEDAHDESIRSFHSVLEYFGEDVDKNTPAEYFGAVCAFINKLVAAAEGDARARGS